VIPSIDTPGGKLDLTNNAAVVEYLTSSPIDSIRQQVAAGTIFSSVAGVDQGIGITESGAAGTFAGTPVDATAVLLRLTVVGDANLNGRVDTADFNALSAAFNQSGQYWGAGDFNNDGMVNALDFNALATHFGQAMAAPLPAQFGFLVPEPSSALLMGLTL